MLAVLRVAAVKSGTLDDCIGHLRMLRRCARVAEPIPEAEVRAALRTAQAKLQRAKLIEVAAFQAKLRASGYNPAKELNDRLIAKMSAASRI